METTIGLLTYFAKIDTVGWFQDDHFSWASLATDYPSCQSSFRRHSLFLMCLLWRQAKCCGESGIKAMDTNSKSDMAIKVFPKGAPCWWPGLWWSLHVWPPYIEVKWVYFSIFTQSALYCVNIHNELKILFFTQPALYCVTQNELETIFSLSHQWVPFAKQDPTHRLLVLLLSVASVFLHVFPGL